MSLSQTDELLVAKRKVENARGRLSTLEGELQILPRHIRKAWMESDTLQAFRELSARRAELPALIERAAEELEEAVREELEVRHGSAPQWHVDRILRAYRNPMFQRPGPA